MKKSKPLERLRDSYHEYKSACYEKGIKFGKEWCKDIASYQELKIMSDFTADDAQFDAFVHDCQRNGLRLEEALPNMLFHEIWFGDACAMHWSSVLSDEWEGGLEDDFVLGFVDGAMKYFDKVHDQIISAA